MMAEVLNAPREGSPHFSGLRRTTSHSFLNSDLTNSYLQPSTKKPYDNAEHGTKHSASPPSPAPSSPLLSHNSLSSHTSYPSTVSSSLSLDTKADGLQEDDITFPAYDGAIQFEHEEDVEFSHTINPPTPSPEDDGLFGMRPRKGSADLPISIGDDQTIERQPTRHVDYLSHEWKEEDIWSSWRYIVARRGAFSNSTRLENASWRTWAKSKNKLKTISPETLNWLKDCDVTWLYGPLQTDIHKPVSTNPSPPSRLHPSSSFLHKKPILKKRSASEAILQRSISSHSLLKHAGAILKAQQANPATSRPNFLRVQSDFSAPVFSRTSTLNTPAGDDTMNLPSARLSVASSGTQTPSERRHIHFNNEVVQCIAVERPVVDYEDDDATVDDDEEGDDDDEEDEGIVMMKQAPLRARSNTRSVPRTGSDDARKIIAPLPSTTLRGDTPEPSESGPPKSNGIWPPRPILSPTPSDATLRPSRSSNFLLDDDDEVGDLDWDPPQSRGISIPLHQSEPGYDEEDETDPGPGLHRTPSGMFMPYDEDEEEAIMNHTLFGRVVDTVNTARDIAHVIWNVGWRR